MFFTTAERSLFLHEHDNDKTQLFEFIKLKTIYINCFFHVQVCEKV